MAGVTHVPIFEQLSYATSVVDTSIMQRVANVREKNLLTVKSCCFKIPRALSSFCLRYGDYVLETQSILFLL